MKKIILKTALVLFFGSIAVIGQAPRVTHIYPDAGINEDSITAHIYGDSFAIDTVSSVKLIKSGYSDINGGSIDVVSNKYLTCSFDLTNDSVGLYNLVITNSSDSDTLPGCFTIYSSSVSPYMWDKTTIGSGGSFMYAVSVGDGDNDGYMEVYVANNDNNIYQFKWNGSSWDSTNVGFGGNWMFGVAVGDGNNDGELEVYGSSGDHILYQFKWNGMSWDRDSVGFGTASMFDVAVGDGNNDGEIEVYGANDDRNLYQFEWNGVDWDRTTIATGTAPMYRVTVGDGNNDGELEVYVTSSGYIYQIKWNGISWDKTTLGSGESSMYGVDIGDGNNDGEREVYGSNYDSKIYQFKWNGVDWDSTTVGSGGNWMYRVGVGDGDGDDKIEVYGVNLDDTLYQFEWDGIVWEKMVMGYGDEAMYSVAVGDGNNDGGMEVYAGNTDTKMYQFKTTAVPVIVLSDTIHNFGSIPVGDSIDWQYLILKNVGSDTLFVDSLISDTSDYVVVDPSFPDTLFISDSTLVTVRFKPSIMDTIYGTLSVYSNDPLNPVINVFLTGRGIEDPIPPIPFSLISPPDSAMLVTNRPTFIWEASYDSLSGLKNYEVYINDTLRDSVPDTTWTVDYDLSEGFHDWFVIAYDSIGNSRQSSQTWSVLIDTSPPLIESTTVWSDTSSAGPFPVYTKVTDIIEIDTVLLYFKRIEDPLWISFEMADSGNGWYYGEISQAFIQDDTVKYYIYARDVLLHDTTDPAGAPSNYYSFIAWFSGVEEEKPAKFSFSVNTLIKDKTTFSISLPEKSVVSLVIFDIMGRIIKEPLSGEYTRGYYNIHFKSENSGIYFYLFKSPFGDRRGKIIIF